MIAAALALVVAAVFTLFVVHELQAVGLAAAILLRVWLVLPYAVLAALLVVGGTTASAGGRVVTTLLVTTGGCLFLLNAVFLSKDPQGGIAVLFLPVYQGIGILVLQFLSSLLGPKH